MSVQITTSFVKQYNANIEILSQQMGMRIANFVRMESQTGQHQFFDQISATAAVLLTSRHSDTPIVDTPHARRRVTLKDYVLADLIDELDKVKMLTDPTSAYAINIGMAMGRAKDDEVINAAFATAYTGVDGGTSTSFDTANNQIAVGATGLTLAKLLTAKEIFDGYDIDPSLPRHIACAPSQISDLLNTSEIKSSDYNTVKALARGEINTYLGFDFHMTNRILKDGSGYRRVLCWVEDGLLLSIGKDEKGPKARIEERADKNYSVQVFNSMSIGATRMDEQKVIEILCTE
jgi:hypothetical protein